MDVNSVLMRLIKDYKSLPALKMAWSCQMHIPDSYIIPKIPPSHYLRELNYTTEERQSLLMEQHKTIKISNCGFKIYVEPAIIVFQNYKPGDKLSATITVQNVHKAMQKITFDMNEEGPFFIDNKSQRIAKFASGLLTTVSIQFRPDDKTDYFHKVVINVNGVRIAIPVLGFGARGIIHIPDKIKFGRVPVKHLNRLMTPVFNVGNSTARFLALTSAPFEVFPEKAVVLPGDSLNLRVSYHSKYVEKSTGHLCIKYENGEEVYVSLEAEAINQDISVGPENIEFEDTFVGMVNKAKITIQNNSPVKAKFNWRNYVSYAYYHSKIHQGSNDSSLHSSGQNFQSLKGSRGYSNAINSITQSQKHISIHGEQNEPFYIDDVFRVEPPTGEVQPYSSTSILVWFAPLTPRMYYSEIFCDITGLEERVEIRFTGKALGPKFKLGFDELDIGTVNLGGGHTYEIPVTNTSAVEGTIIFTSFAGLMESQFSIKPSLMSLGPGEFGAFFLSFRPGGVPTSIFEELNFEIEATREVISLIVKGSATYPDIRFGESILKFGEVSYGFPDTCQTVLLNYSMIPLKITLTVNPDGTEKVLEAEDIIEAIKEPDYIFPTEPQEFRIEPSTFLLEPRGYQRVSVTITAAKYGPYNRSLCARLGAKDAVVTEIPIEANCVLPTLIKPEELVFDCVAGIPTPASLTIHNPSALSGVFCCVPELTEMIQYTSDNFVGIAKARESVIIPFSIMAKKKGETEGRMEIFVAGKLEPMLDITFTCLATSAAEVLKLSKNLIELGNCKVREKTTVTFSITNSTTSTSIPYTISLVKGGKLNEIWETDPNTGIVTPNLEENIIQLSVTLFENGAYFSTFRMYIAGTQEYLEFQATAVGIGCSLMFEPEVDETGILDLGYVFTNTPKIVNYEVTNPGIFNKLLEWKYGDEDPPTITPVPIPKKTRLGLSDMPEKKTSIKPSRREYSPFEVIPMKKGLNAQEQMTLSFKAYSTMAKSFSTKFTLWSYVEIPKNADKKRLQEINKAMLAYQTGKNQEQNAMDKLYFPTRAQTITIRATFSPPKLFFSQYLVEFKVEPNPTDMSSICQQIITITATNPCEEKLEVIFHTLSPFGIVINEEGDITEEWKHTFEPHEKVGIRLIFDASDCPKETEGNIFTGQMNVVYEKHPKSDEVIKLRGTLILASVVLDRSELDFGEVINGEEKVLFLNVSNPGKYCITYKVFIVSTSVSMEVVNPFGTTLPLPSFGSFDSDVDSCQEYPDECIKAQQTIMECAEFDNERIFAAGDEGSKLEKDRKKCLCEKEKFAYFYDKVYRGKLMSFLGLKDPPQEFNNELTYFHYFNQKTPVHDGVTATPNELIDAVPARGIIQSGRAQMLTVVFFPQSNIHFEATICISTENGAPKYVKIKGKSIPPPNPYAYLTSSFPAMECKDAKGSKKSNLSSQRSPRPASDH